MNVSQRVRELYEQGYAPSLIADMVETSLNNVTRAISTHRKKTGRIVAVTKERDHNRYGCRIESEQSKDWRYFNYKKSVMGARAALREMNQ